MKPLRGGVALALAALLPLLAGCSGEPSEADMRRLVEAHTRRALERQGQGGFRAFDVFRKQGCVAAKAKSGGTPGQYDCYYAATFVPQPGQPPLTVNGKGRFGKSGTGGPKGDGGLVFEDLGAQPR